MIPIVLQTINYYLKNFKTPKLNEIEIRDKSLLEEKWSLFVTIYKKWEIRWSSGNIKEIKPTIAEELIENTINAIYWDSRFEPVKLSEVQNLKIRIDLIINKTILEDKEFLEIDPTKFWILAIKKDYDSMAMILPNINPLFLTWEDLIGTLELKLESNKFEENDYILYKIETKVIDNFEWMLF